MATAEVSQAIQKFMLWLDGETQEWQPMSTQIYCCRSKNLSVAIADLERVLVRLNHLSLWSLLTPSRK